MIFDFASEWPIVKPRLAVSFAADEPRAYLDIVKRTFQAISDSLRDSNRDTYGSVPDATKIVEVDHGDYQGTLLFLIPSDGYRPSTYWATTVSYGSCPGCDTLQSVMDIPDKEQRIADLLTLALHMVQQCKMVMSGGDLIGGAS